MNKKLVLASFVILFTNMMFAQIPTIQWQKIYGGSSDDRAFDLQATPDGGYIMAGDTESNNWDVTGGSGTNGYYNDYWIVKLNPSGVLQWQKSFGGIYFDIAKAIKPTADGGYVVAGDSFINSARGYDWRIAKLNSTGEILWQKTLGGSGEERANAIQTTLDGGFIVVGSSGSSNGDSTVNHGEEDCWIVKFNGNGDIQWQKSLGGRYRDMASSIQITADGGFIVAGNTDSNDGDVSGNHGGTDAWVVKLDSNGIIEWQKTFGGSRSDYSKSLQCTPDGGYILAGYTYSYRNDYEGYNDRSDYWIVKLDNTGNLEWQRSIGGGYSDFANDIQNTTDGGYIVVGESNSLDGNITGNLGKTDAWLVKLSGSGAIQWQKSLGGSEYDYGHVVLQNADGSYVIAGYSDSGIGDNTNVYGGYGYWIIKLASSNLEIAEMFNKNNLIVENPVKNQLNIKSAETVVAIQLYTLDGKLIRSANSKNMTVSDIPKGNYLLTIQLENGKTISEKIIKE